MKSKLYKLLFFIIFSCNIESNRGFRDSYTYFSNSPVIVERGDRFKIESSLISYDPNLLAIEHNIRNSLTKMGLVESNSPKWIFSISFKEQTEKECRNHSFNDPWQHSFNNQWRFHPYNNPNYREICETTKFIIVVIELKNTNNLSLNTATIKGQSFEILRLIEESISKFIKLFSF